MYAISIDLNAEHSDLRYKDNVLIKALCNHSL
jgi:hypothetical protein